MDETRYPPNYGIIMMEVLKSLPVWVKELPAESYAAEVSSRIVLHPEAQKFIDGDQHVADEIQAGFEKELLERIRHTNRYKEDMEECGNE